MKRENNDLCKTCKHFWLDFPMPLDHYVAHCEIVDDRKSFCGLDDVVPYPCTKCPFDCYSKK